MGSLKGYYSFYEVNKFRTQTSNMNKRRHIQIGKYFPPVWGGIETVTYELHKLLEHYELETHIFSNETQVQKNVHAHKFIKIFKVPVSISIFIMILRLARNSVVLLHLPNPFVLLVCGLMPSKLKLRIIWHAPARSNFVLAQINKISYYIAKKNIKEIIIPYAAHRKTLPSNWTEIKTRVLKFPLEPTIRKIAKMRPKIKTNNEYFKIIMIGRLVDYKNYELALDAVHAVLGEGLKIQVDIVGSGPKYQKLKKFCIQKNIDKYVSFFGSISDEEKHELLKKAD